MFTKAFEMRYPVFKEVGSPYAQLLPWQHTLFVSLNLIRTVCAFVLHVRSNLSLLKNMQNFENLDVFEILITQKLLKCPKDPFLRSALIYIFHVIMSNISNGGLVLFDLILYVQSTIFQLNRDGSSWVEPVLS